MVRARVEVPYGSLPPYADFKEAYNAQFEEFVALPHESSFVELWKRLQEHLYRFKAYGVWDDAHKCEALLKSFGFRWV